jgi:hypothetical protein
MQQSYNVAQKTPKPDAPAVGPQPHGKQPTAIGPNSRYGDGSKAHGRLEMLL